MHLVAPHRYWILLLVLMPSQAPAAPMNAFSTAEHEAVETFLEKDFTSANAAMVIGLVDENGSRIYGAGTLDNGTENKVDGDSVFFIGSVSKTFTALLLLEMAQRGEVNLDDPLAKYLPETVDVPVFDGKKISLLHLATNTAGLPMNPDNMVGANGREEYESYTVDKMLEFLDGFQLQRAPGAKYAYSNVGMALLGHALERHAEKDFESLLVERICRPLTMNSTCITLTPELAARRAMGHDDAGQPSPPWKFEAYHPAGDIHSSVNDLLKYAAAQAGLNRSPLTPLMEKSHEFRHEDVGGISGQGPFSLMGRTAMPWVDRGAFQPHGMDLRGHAGGAGSYHAWVGFDKQQQRGVVVLSTANDLSVEAVGWTILQRLPLTDESKRSFAREMVGVGVALEMAKQPAMLRIMQVLPETPAARAGLSAGLVILKIDDTATTGKSLAECVDLIRGPVGAKVRLELMDSEKNTTDLVELTRQRFKT
jgi:serine-type D-Ala-D-Ala carboxypeptidase/endopeptidase